MGSGGNLRARLNRPALERSFCKAPSKAIEQTEREGGKRSGGRGERESKRGEGRGMREEERKEINRKEREERKENFLLLIDIMKDFHLLGPFNLTLPLLIKEYFSFSGGDQPE